MNISRVITFLVAGIVIGAILFFAGFGVLNLFKSESDAPVVVSDSGAAAVVVEDKSKAEVPPAPAPQAVPVNPPKIEVTSSNQTGGDANSGDTLQGEGTSNSPFRIKPLNTNANDSPSDTNEEIKTVAFGTLTLSTVNAVNSAPVNADFLIENADGVAIALVKDTSTSTLSLPVGDYKITVSQGAEKVVRFLGVKDGRNGSEIFELDVPVLTDEAPVTEVAGAETDAPVYTNSNEAAAPADSSIAANPAQPEAVVSTPDSTTTPETTVETAPSSVAATSESATPAQSDNAASTPSTGTPGNTTAQANSSTASTRMGGLRLSALTEQGKRPTTASFYIQRLNGQNVETIRNVKTQQLNLPAGKYKVTAKTNIATVVKQVEVLATRGVHEIFLISDQPGTTQQDTSTAATTSQNTTPAGNTATAAPASSPNTTASDQANNKTGKLELFAQKASNNSAVKSNFYVQMPNGKMVASKVYVDSIGYKLPAGKYKVLVRATGYKNKSTTLNVRAGQTRREVFKLESANPAGQTQNNSANSAQPAASTQPRQQAPSAPARPTQNATRAYGGLTVNIVSAADGAPLPADMIVITQRDGKQVKQANGVSSASFDLPPREFLIRVSYGGLTTNHQVNILTGRLAIKTISFDTDRMLRQERRRLRRERRNR